MRLLEEEGATGSVPPSKMKVYMEMVMDFYNVAYSEHRIT